MMTVTEKAAYLRGLAEGLDLDETKPEGKIIKAMLDVIDDLALSVADLDDSVEAIAEQLDAVDEDLEELEEFVYEDDCDCCGDYDEDYVEVECPACHEVICIDEDVLMDGEMNCPNCDELLEFDLEEGECDCDECEE